MTQVVQRFAVTPFFRWYDLWIGAYWDRDAKVLYVCPLPMIGLKIKMPFRRGKVPSWTSPPSSKDKP
jgi:hypothetical protein